MLAFWFLLGFSLLIAGCYGLVVYLLLFQRWPSWDQGKKACVVDEDGRVVWV